MAAPDGGWGWVALFASLLLYVILGGTERAFGVWYVAILDRYESSSALTEWLIGVHCATRMTVYPLVSMLYARTSLRVMGFIGSFGLSACIFLSAFTQTYFQLFIVFGVMGGLISSLVSFPSTVILLEYFDKRKTLAMGIASSGSGLGSFILSPLLSYCFENFSYLEAVSVLAGVTLQSLIACALCFPVYEEDLDESSLETMPLLKHEITEKLPLKIVSSYQAFREPKVTYRVRKAQGKRLFEPTLLWNPVMLLYMLGSFVTTMGTFSVLQLVVHFAVTRGLTLESASLLLTGTGSTEAFGRLFGGLIFSLKALNPWTATVWNCCPLAVGISCILITLCYSFWEFLPVLLYASLSYSFINAFSAFVISSVFEKHLFGPAWSMYINTNGIGILCGTYLAGYMKDASGSYEVSYYVMAGLSALASLIYWLAHLLVRRRRGYDKLLA